jgi:hypothetical protein
MSLLGLIVLLLYVKTFWGYVFGVMCVFMGMGAAEENLYRTAVVLAVVGVVSVFISIGW